MRKKTIALTLNDESDYPLFYDRTLLMEINEEQVGLFQKMFADLKSGDYTEISKNLNINHWCIDDEIAHVEKVMDLNPVLCSNPAQLADLFSDLGEKHSLNKAIKVTVDVFGNIYFQIQFTEKYGESFSSISLKRLLEFIPAPPSLPKPTKEHILDMVLGKSDIVNRRFIFDTEGELNAFLRGMDEVFGYEDYDVVDFDESAVFEEKRISLPDPASQRITRLKENNMLYRKGDIVEMAEPQDEEHEEWISCFQGDTYVIAEVKEESETYLLRHILSDPSLKNNYIVHNGKPAHFIDADLAPANSCVFRLDMVIALSGRFKTSLPYEDIVSCLQRPYVQIPKQYESAFANLIEKGLNGEKTDFVQYQGDIFTFGDADGYLCLMPFKKGTDMHHIADNFITPSF